MIAAMMMPNTAAMSSSTSCDSSPLLNNDQSPPYQTNSNGECPRGVKRKSIDDDPCETTEVIGAEHQQQPPQPPSFNSNGSFESADATTVSSSNLSPETRRPRLDPGPGDPPGTAADSSSSSSSLLLLSVASSPSSSPSPSPCSTATTAPVAAPNCSSVHLQLVGVPLTDPPSPSASSEAMSDDDEDSEDDDDDDEDDDDEDEDDEDEDDEEEEEYDAKVDLYAATNGPNESSGYGYPDDPRASNPADGTTPSTGSTTPGERSPPGEFGSSILPPLTGTNGSCYSTAGQGLDLGSLSASANNPAGGYSSPPATSRNTLNNGYYCAYSVASSSPNGPPKYSQPHQQQQQSFSSRSNRQNSSNNSLLHQRQQIFNLSMCKLNRFRQSSDLSLHRSVMICNTLRMLEKELEKDGCKVMQSPAGVSFISPVPPDLDFLPILQTSPSNSSSPPSSPSIDACMNESFPAGTGSPGSSNPPLYPSSYQSHPCEAQSMDTATSCTADYDKYFSVESNSSSGRATPFIKSFNDGPYSNRVTGGHNESNSNGNNASAFWIATADDPMSPGADRSLSNLNWSSMLTFNSSPSSSTGSGPVGTEDGALARHQSSTSESPIGPAAIISPHYSAAAADQQQQSSSAASVQSPTSAPMLGNTSQTNGAAGYQQQSSPTQSGVPSVSSPIAPSTSDSTTTFATLLPPASSLTGNDSDSRSCGSNDSQSSNSPPSDYYSANTYDSSTVSSSPNDNGPSAANAANPNTNGSSTYMMMNSYLAYNSGNGSETEIFGDIDLSLYDFDLLSPLSPPNGTVPTTVTATISPTITKPIISAEELMRNINGSENGGGHYAMNGFPSGQSYGAGGTITTSATSTTTPTANGYCSNGVMVNGHHHHHHLMTGPAMMNGGGQGPATGTPVSSTTASTATTLPNCGSTSTSTGLHIHGTGRGGYYKSSEERDQQTITTIKCHN